PRTLAARVRALLRRSEQQTAAIQRYGAVELDEGLQALRLGERPPVRLTRLEFRLVQLLMVHQGQPVATERLLRHVWGAAAGDDRQLLKQLVHRLRHKLEDDPAEPRWLCTVPGVGYCLAIGEDSATPPSQE